MPINKKMLDAMKKTYGPKKGEQIYYKMEAEGKVPKSSGVKKK